MSETLKAVQGFVAAGQVRFSGHGYDELSADGLYARDIIAGVAAAVVVEDYPAFPKGPAVLVLQWDRDGKPFTSSGESPGVSRRRRSWSRRIARNPTGGMPAS